MEQEEASLKYEYIHSMLSKTRFWEDLRPFLATDQSCNRVVDLVYYLKEIEEPSLKMQ